MKILTISRNDLMKWYIFFSLLSPWSWYQQWTCSPGNGNVFPHLVSTISNLNPLTYNAKDTSHMILVMHGHTQFYYDIKIQKYIV